ncbi:MAG TPA: hypothetical protein VHL11_11780 [Phototrophicaceae bacterium]|jgi:hypothetical protein|nr:hypothetical protein [Phototrophicaceae bacterium]
MGDKGKKDKNKKKKKVIQTPVREENTVSTLLNPVSNSNKNNTPPKK